VRLYCDVADEPRLSLALDWPHLARWRTTYHRDDPRRVTVYPPRALTFTVAERPRYWPGVLVVDTLEPAEGGGA